MERAQIALALHVHVFQLPLDVIRAGQHSCVAVEAHGTSEVIQPQIFNFHSITIRGEAQLIGRCDVVKLAIVARGHRLKAVTNIVAIEVHQKTHKSYVVGWNMLLKIAVIRIAERWIQGWLQPLVDAVHTHKGLELVRVVTLI